MITFEVLAGWTPDQPIPQYTKRWTITPAEYHSADETQKWALLNDRQAKANEYAATLRSPEVINWVRVDWIYNL